MSWCVLLDGDRIDGDVVFVLKLIMGTSSRAGRGCSMMESEGDSSSLVTPGGAGERPGREKYRAARRRLHKFKEEQGHQRLRSQEATNLSMKLVFLRMHFEVDSQ